MLKKKGKKEYIYIIIYIYIYEKNKTNIYIYIYILYFTVADMKYSSVTCGRREETYRTAVQGLGEQRLIRAWASCSLCTSLSF